LPKLKVGVTSASFLGLKNTCPSCGFPTLDERIRNEICRICSWQDDGQDDHDADEVFGGPNGAYSLTDSRQEYYKEFEELKRESTRPGEQLTRIDELIIKNDASDLKEIMELLEVVKSCYIMNE
jgi:hypothetical protein